MKKKLLNSKLLLIVLVIASLFFSCKAKKEIVYFQGELNSKEQVNTNYNPVLKCDDLLSITVLGIDVEAVKPFNLPLVNAGIVGGYTQGAPTPSGFLIGPDGCIDLPVIGKIKLAELKRSQAIDSLKKSLEQYIQNPTILIRILNYKVTVLGDVKNPGTFTIPNEKISIIEALGIAGDLNITGLRKNIKVVRETEGKKKEFIIDLTKNDVFNSPVYYLQQNDLVYVEPNRSKINSSLINSSNTSIAISAVSLIATLIVLLTK
ncbi:MAG: polysaccharide biosynthesis/export family protein [Bacteroidota bacterium]|jgi:polysaccharide export outer membrane protein